MQKVKHWQDPVNAVIGAWLVLSPWVLAFANKQFAMINAVVVGVAVVGLALWVLMTDAEFKGQLRSLGMR